MEQRFDVQGMTCAHCVKAVTAAIEALDPAAAVTVDLAGRQVRVDSTVAPERIAAAIRDEGYTVA
ncbi:MAG: heavy-metal-associated domain-containing protein [Burkholderiales bacterium]|nr:cation transporter [Burkholderiales bacterium]